MALANWYYKTKKAWTIGPITFGRERISGISGGSMVCKWYTASGTLVATVTGSYEEIASRDYFHFVLGSDEQDDFVEGEAHFYEHILTVDSQDYMALPESDVGQCVGKAIAISRLSDA